MDKFKVTICALCVLASASAIAQQGSPEPASATPTIEQQTPASAIPEQPAPIEPPVMQSAPVQQQAPAADVVPGMSAKPVGSSKSLNEFQGDDLGQVLRLLARQAKISLVLSDKVDQQPLKVTMRLEDKSPLESIKIISQSKGLVVDVDDGVYYVKTQEEKAKEPTESAHYTFSYASVDKVMPLLTASLQGGVAPQFDARTNTVFFRETHSNMPNIKQLLETIDRPTRQVMIEARLVEVTANPKQGYGINWGGVVGSNATPQTFKYGGLNSALPPTGNPTLSDFVGQPQGGNLLSGTIAQLAPQIAILTAPQMSLTMRLLNEDSDAEFLANPRIVTANNQKATIKITRNQPVPQLNFNEQTATAVFGGFQDKEYGNTLSVTPVINKDDYVTMLVQPEISNRVDDAVFTFAGATVKSPIIDKRTLESNVLIHSGDTLAIGGLLQDEDTKSRTKVPVAGDIPILGYLFQERLNTRTKRNLLCFVTPCVIKQGYGTGLEDQVTGLKNSGNEFADPRGWRNNAKGAFRLVPPAEGSMASDYPPPGCSSAASSSKNVVRYRASAQDR